MNILFICSSSIDTKTTELFPIQFVSTDSLRLRGSLITLFIGYFSFPTGCYGVTPT